MTVSTTNTTRRYPNSLNKEKMTHLLAKFDKFIKQYSERKNCYTTKQARKIFQYAYFLGKSEGAMIRRQKRDSIVESVAKNCFNGDFELAVNAISSDSSYIDGNKTVWYKIPTDKNVLIELIRALFDYLNKNNHISIVSENNKIGITGFNKDK